MARERELTWEERIRWGKCFVCSAEDGEFCHSEVGLTLGQKTDGSRLKTGEGAHIGRLNNAPTRVREVPVD